MSALRVLMIGPPGSTAGGMGTVTEGLTGHFLKARDVELEVRSSGGGFGVPGYWRFVPAFAKASFGSYDVLHLHVASRGSTVRKALFAFAAHARGKPYVIHLHGASYVDFLDSLPSEAVKFVGVFFSWAADIIVLGQFWADLISERLPVDPDRISVVHNGVPSVLGRDWRLADRAPGPAILWLGEQGRRKGFELFLRAAEELLPQYPDLRVTIAGTQPDPDLAQEAQALRSRFITQVELPGTLFGAGKQEAFRNSDIFVLPSRAEGMPMVILEAMSTGLAIVTTRVGSISEIFPRSDEDGVLFVQVGDLSDLVVTLRRVIDGAEFRHELGARAYHRWGEGFTIDGMAAGVKAAWLRALEGRD